MGCCVSASKGAADPDADRPVSLTRPTKRTHYKLILLGAAGSGKSCLWNRIINGEFSESLQPTVTSEPAKRELPIDGNPVNFEVWDCSGQIDKQRISTANDPIFRRVDGCFLCFDLADRSTFDNVVQWKKELDTNHKGATPPLLFLLGLKSDLPAQVTEDDMKRLSGQLDCEYGVCSSKRDEGVAEVFTRFGGAAKLRRDKEERGELL